MFAYNDGGRQAAGFKGYTRDCVARAIVITTGLEYKQVYNTLAHHNAIYAKRGFTARKGIITDAPWFKEYMVSLGFVWTSTMHRRVNLRADELPSGRLVVSVSKHMVAVIDGVIHDTFESSRQGRRCVYGYWTLTSVSAV